MDGTESPVFDRSAGTLLLSDVLDVGQPEIDMAEVDWATLNAAHGGSGGDLAVNFCSVETVASTGGSLWSLGDTIAPIAQLVGHLDSPVDLS